MKPYVFLRYVPFLYNIVYSGWEKNHENKIIHGVVNNILGFWDKLLIFIPAVFIIKLYLPNNVFFEELVHFPVLNSLFDIFMYNN